jgi:ATP synthase protein I
MKIESSNKLMWRGALLPAMVASLISIGVAFAVSGRGGLFGAVLACFTVVIFFSVSLLVARLTKNADPISTMALAMFSYFTKLLLMAGFLIAVTRLTEPETVDRRAFGASALFVAFAWLAGEVRAFFRLRLELTIPESGPGTGD